MKAEVQDDAEDIATAPQLVLPDAHELPLHRVCGMSGYSITSSAAWPCSYFSSFQPFRSYFHDHRDAKICDARSQILSSTTNFSENRGIER